MTHDELLAKLEEPNPTAVYATQVATELAREKESYILNAFQKVGINPNVVIEQDVLITELKAQIRAVVELHKPDDKSYSGEIGCIGCGFNSEYGTWEQDYPCPTIQAIEAELK